MRLSGIFLSFIFCLCLSTPSYSQIPSRFQYWKIGSHYRGFNIVADENQKQLTDLSDLQRTGATIVHIGTKGFRNVEAPYNPVDSNISFLDAMVAMCRNAKLHYSLTVRQGPGRRDIYLESIGEPQSTIWTDTAQQRQYASMLREIVSRYKDDSLFIGIAPICEPNPLSKNNFYYDSASLAKLLFANTIDLQAIMQVCVDSIRSVSKDLPILIQGPAYAAPEFIQLTPKINDPFIVYEFHCYRPHEYVLAADTSSLVYPGYYISYIERKLSVYHNKEYLKDSVFKFINNRQKETGAPIFMGEFGIQWAHSGGEELLSDLTSIAIENGWHFAYWAYDGLHHGWGWDYEVMPTSYLIAVEVSFENNSFVTSNDPTPSDIKIFPNPSHSGIIEISGGGTKLLLYDVLGNKRKEIPMQNNKAEIHTDEFSSGEYLVILESQKRISTKRLVITK